MESPIREETNLVVPGRKELIQGSRVGQWHRGLPVQRLALSVGSCSLATVTTTFPGRSPSLVVEED